MNPMKPSVKPDIFATGVVNMEACSKSQIGGGRYTLIKILGRGGMGIVWLARDELLATEVALKFLPPQIRFDSAALDDLRRETSRSRKLTHPNILRIHDFYDAKNEEAFISMEYIEGSTLAALRIEQPQRVLTWEFLAPLVKQLCDGLDYAHGERVIHRDLKPANLMLDKKGRIKLADFGIARTLNDTMTRVSMNPGTSGTLLYMSPQQLEGKSPRIADDIYALGATLYELLTSKPPFYSGDFLHQIRNVAPVPLRERLKEWNITNEIPPHVERTVLACLAKDESQRPQSAREVAAQLELAFDNERAKSGRFFSGKKYYVLTGAAIGATITAASFFLNMEKNRSPHTVRPHFEKIITDPWNEMIKESKTTTLSSNPFLTTKPENNSAPTILAQTTAPPIPAATTDAPGTQNEFTALQLVKLGNHYINEESQDEVIQITSEKTVESLTPESWRINYYNPKATFKVTEVRFENGKMIRVREPDRVFNIFAPGARKPMDLSTINLDSDDALKVVMDLPEAQAQTIISVEMKLQRGFGGFPVWQINLFGESQSNASYEKDLGTVILLATDGKILKNTLVKKNE
jgi:serine/threonine protein kinase